MHAYPHTAACAAPSTLKHTNHRTFNPTSLPNPLRDTHTHTHILTLHHNATTPPLPHAPAPGEIPARADWEPHRGHHSRARPRLLRRRPTPAPAPCPRRPAVRGGRAVREGGPGGARGGGAARRAGGDAGKGACVLACVCVGVGCVVWLRWGCGVGLVGYCTVGCMFIDSNFALGFWSAGPRRAGGGRGREGDGAGGAAGGPARQGRPATRGCVFGDLTASIETAPPHTHTQPRSTTAHTTSLQPPHTKPNTTPAARAREESRDGLDVSESMLMGGGGREGDEARRRMERQRERQAQKAGDRDRCVLGGLGGLDMCVWLWGLVRVLGVFLGGIGM